MMKRWDDTDVAALLARGNVHMLDGHLKLGSTSHASGTLPGRDELELPFMRRVRATAHATGWLMYHTVDAKRSDPGFPDLILLRPGEGIAAECKRNTEKPSPEQITWLTFFASLPGMEACVWRPRDEAAILVRLTRPSCAQAMPTMVQRAGSYDVWTH
jgi:hypothetical protein